MPETHEHYLNEIKMQRGALTVTRRHLDAAILRAIEAQVPIRHISQAAQINPSTIYRRYIP